MPLFNMLPLGGSEDVNGENTANTAASISSGVFNPQMIPKSMDVFSCPPQYFLPEGKTFDDLTPEELAKLKSQYRFSPYRPGIYQGITGIGGMAS